MADNPSRDLNKFMLRLPQGMRSNIAERAKTNLRSMNSEIVMILASALGDQGVTVAEDGPGKAASATVSSAGALQGPAPIHG